MGLVSASLYVLNGGVTKGVASESLSSCFRFNGGVANMFVLSIVVSERGCVEVDESEAESISM